jgi:ribonuclease HIII
MTDSSAPKGPFVAQLKPEQHSRLKRDLVDQSFEMSQPAHTQFSAKKKGLSVTLYTSGKLVVQGKEMNQFVEFYLEPEILGTFDHAYKKTASFQMADLHPHIGIDESGKGDFFGPLCIAGVYGDATTIQELHKMGVRDSKALNDPAITVMAKKIRATCIHHVVRINPPKYNELYGKFGNLNTFLAWGHATTIEELVRQTGCKDVIIDQFAHQRVVEQALAKKNLEISLTQRHRAEADVVVAAASILARQAFLDGLEALGEQIEDTLPKGASAQTVAKAKQLLIKHGPEVFPLIAKIHFKTYRELFDR